eukprot:gnl/TRDRNA2_/TRDRNA2_163293_c1_seq1.p1 gnl/TRDRNA2_/TRDRNA2_163293_c1~~gnl/TRDRNA2_/TRDRNA2_163293_c1_seq1.p1  ORF type:complete len:136 (-),score=36.20 gnl/TRDRNA2_/TRDRNA2_163293_c1_seq1:149-556(-)
MVEETEAADEVAATEQAPDGDVVATAGDAEGEKEGMASPQAEDKEDSKEEVTEPPAEEVGSPVPEVKFGGPTAAEAREFWESKEKVGTDNQQEFYIGSEPGSRRASREESAQPEAEPGSRRSSREENAQPEMLSY